VILLRNVMIYFDLETKQQVLAHPAAAAARRLLHHQPFGDLNGVSTMR
jgi:hypothetical protein